MVRPSERSCNYAKSRFDGWELSIKSVILSLRYDYIMLYLRRKIIICKVLKECQKQERHLKVVWLYSCYII